MPFRWVRFELPLGSVWTRRARFSWRSRTRWFVVLAARRLVGLSAHRPSGRGPGCGFALERHIAPPSRAGGLMPRRSWCEFQLFCPTSARKKSYGEKTVPCPGVSNSPPLTRRPPLRDGAKGCVGELPATTGRRVDARSATIHPSSLFPPMKWDVQARRAAITTVAFFSAPGCEDPGRPFAGARGQSAERQFPALLVVWAYQPKHLFFSEEGCFVSRVSAIFF